MILLPGVYTFAQTNPNFDVNLLLDYSAVEQSLALFADQPVSTTGLAALRGNQIAASTTALISNRIDATRLLQSYLDSLKYHQIIQADIYHLEAARRNGEAIRQLLDEMKRHNFNRRVVATVEQIFPPDAAPRVTIPVYVVAIGHENVDAYVRRIVWHDDVPEFVGENEGELTIIVNLAHAVGYGINTDDRFTSLLGVVAHEVFHAAFDAYKETSSSWKRYQESYRHPFDQLLDLTQNEGIAYYLSLDQQGGGRLPREWLSRTQQAFSTFNKCAAELLSGRLTASRAAELIRRANLSGSWDNYGAMTGMFMAREIDLRLGRSALIETISADPWDFLRKYLSLTYQDSNLPQLDPQIVQEIPPK